MRRKEFGNAICLLVLASTAIGDESAAALQWVPTTNPLAKTNFVRGGWERTGKEALRICRVSHNGSRFIGKEVNHLCNIAEGGQERTVGPYEILIATGGGEGQDYYWVNWSNNSGIPHDAFQGGAASDGREFYVCAAPHEGGVHPGYKPRDHPCWYGWGGDDHQRNSYRILVSGPGPSDPFPAPPVRPVVCRCPGEPVAIQCPDFAGCRCNGTIPMCGGPIPFNPTIKTEIPIN